MVENTTLLCPVCRGSLSFTPHNNNFTCEYCDSQFSLADLKARGIDVNAPTNTQKVEVGRAVEEDEKMFTTVTDDSTYGVENAELVVYTCPQCRAEIVTSKTTAATNCVYCGNAVVLSSQTVGDFSPQGVVPFKTTREDADKAFKKFMHKPLTPKTFYDQVEVKKVQGVYVPFWLFSGTARGHSCGYCEVTFDRGDDKYEDKYYYLRDSHIQFDDVPVDGSARIEDDAMDSIEPFDLSEIQQYSPMYLTGFLAERYDENSDACYPRAELRVKNSAIDFCREDVIKEAEESSKSMRHLGAKARISGVDLEETAEVEHYSSKYVMLPAWLLYCEYKGKQYLFAMNGQTGKFIGNLPISIPKLIGFSGLGGLVGLIVGLFAGGFIG